MYTDMYIQIFIYIYIYIVLTGPVRPPLSVPGNRELGKDRRCQAHRLKWTSDLHILHHDNQGVTHRKSRADPEKHGRFHVSS